MTCGISKNIAVSVILPPSIRLNSAYRIIVMRPVGRMPSHGWSNRPIRWPIDTTQTELKSSISLCPARKCLDAAAIE